LREDPLQGEARIGEMREGGGVFFNKRETPVGFPIRKVQKKRKKGPEGRKERRKRRNP